MAVPQEAHRESPGPPAAPQPVQQAVRPILGAAVVNGETIDSPLFCAPLAVDNAWLRRGLETRILRCDGRLRRGARAPTETLGVHAA
jgi:hypothetical protein